MKLNLHILKEDLIHWNFQGILIDRPTERLCTYSKFCDKMPDSFQTEILYILQAEVLSTDVTCNPRCSILCIGKPPEAWLNSACNFLYTESKISVFELMNCVNERFHYYRQWEDSLQEALDLQLSPQELAQRSLPVIQNTIYAQGAFYRVLCKCVPPLEEKIDFYKQYKKDYDTIPLGGILNVEDINNLISDAEYNRAMYVTEPTIYSGEFYGFRSLFYNIYVDNTFVARVVIDEVVNKFTDKDFALIQIFGSYLKKRLMNSEIYFFDRPREMEQIFPESDQASASAGGKNHSVFG